MLRRLVVLLLLANLVWWAWHWPTLADALGTLHADRDPQRLAQQVEADQVRLLGVATPGAASAAAGVASANAAAPSAPTAVQPASAAASPGLPGSTPAASTAAGAVAASAPANAPICLEAGPLNDAGLAQARRELVSAGASPDRWVEIRRELPGSVAVYMGRFADVEQARRKAEELRGLKIDFEVMVAGPLAPGVVLGRYTSSEQAAAALERLQARGVRTARLATLVPPSAEHVLRVDRADLGLQAQLTANTFAAASAPGARTAWRICNRP